MIVVSNGFHKMHLTIAAREASRRNLLSLAITGIYPTPRVKRIVRASRLGRTGRVARLLEREEAVPAEQLRAIFVPEVIDEVARLSARGPRRDLMYANVEVASMRLYGELAARALGTVKGARLFHFRAGFGGKSINRARENGLVVLCDHALVHPSLLEDLVENRGSPSDCVIGQPSATPLPSPRSPLLRAVLSDINRADTVLVNSHFVKETFITAGWRDDRVRVVYLGVDENFLQEAPQPNRRASNGRLSLVFASRFERRKGAEVLIEALQTIDDDLDWELVVAGPVSADILSAHHRFFQNDRVRVLGPLTRPGFKRAMLDSPVFVFPTFAEGSARAVFEALVCGCYVITTPNAGSIVEDGVHGALVPPGDADGLAAAIIGADRDREMIAEVGMRNHTLMMSHHHQAKYGDDLAALYRALTARGAG